MSGLKRVDPIVNEVVNEMEQVEILYDSWLTLNYRPIFIKCGG